MVRSRTGRERHGVARGDPVPGPDERPGGPPRGADLIDLGVVIERDGMVAVGVYGVNIRAVTGTRTRPVKIPDVHGL